MRDTIIALALGFVMVTLGACVPSEYPVDPADLEGKTESEISVMLEDEGWDVEFLVRSNVEKDQSREFIEYGQVRESDQLAYVIVSATIIDEDKLFEPVDMAYDGPRLDESYLDETEWPFYSEVDGELIGGGGVFEASYTPGDYHGDGGSCIDGDTTVFGYPDKIESRIDSRPPSTRYLNLDTPETVPGEEEEWGFAAKDFVCETLSDAGGVLLQTDPGDSLTGDYDRLLAWVWYIPEGEDAYELLNYNTVRQGLGTVEFEFGAGETGDTVYEGRNYNDWMHQAEDLAMEEERGMHNPDLYDPFWNYDTEAPKQN